MKNLVLILAISLTSVLAQADEQHIAGTWTYSHDECANSKPQDRWKILGLKEMSLTLTKEGKFIKSATFENKQATICVGSFLGDFHTVDSTMVQVVAAVDDGNLKDCGVTMNIDKNARLIYAYTATEKALRIRNQNGGKDVCGAEGEMTEVYIRR